MAIYLDDDERHISCYLLQPSIEAATTPPKYAGRNGMAIEMML